MRKTPFTNPSIWLLPVALVLVFFPLVIGTEVLKWDVMDQFFPCRKFIAESFKQGRFPWWNPYINLGYPFAADPQAGAFYPIAWLFAAVTGYSVWGITLEWLFTLFIAGLGMRALLIEAKLDHASASMWALPYMLSGAVLTNAQHLTWLISVAWLPWVLLGFWQILKKKNGFRAAIGFGISAFLLLTGGYPAFSIILHYILAAVFLLFAFRMWRRKKVKDLRIVTLKLGAAYSVFVLCSAAFLALFFEAKGLISRSALSLPEVYENALPSKALVSLIFPWSTASFLGKWGADISMLGLYASFMALPFFLFGLLRKRDSITMVALVFGLLCLAAALGPKTPVRAFTYRVLPFMDMFRNGALFRFFFLLGFIFIAARGWYFWRGTGAEDRLLNRLVGLCAFVGIALGMYSGLKDPAGFMEFGLSRNRIDHFNTTASPWAHIAWQGIFSAIFVWLPVWWATRKGYKARGFYAAILFADLFLAALILRPATVSYPRGVADLQHTLHERVESTPPALSNPNIFSKSHISGGGIEPIWYNSNMHSQQIAKDGFNNFHLQAYADLVEDPNRFNDAIGHLAHWANGSTEGIEMESFNPNQIKVKTDFHLSGNLTLTQFNYPGWKVFVEGKPAEFSPNEYGFMAVKVSKGGHEVDFKYVPGWRKWLAWASAAFFVLFNFALFGMGLIPKRN